MTGHFQDLTVDHVRIYCADPDPLIAQFGNYGLDTRAEGAGPGAEHSVVLGHDDIRLVLTRPGTGDHPGEMYATQHGYGVSDIALGTADAAGAFHEAVRRGARPIAAPQRDGAVVTASVGGFGDVIHTFVQRDPGGEWSLPGLTPVHRSGTPGIGLRLVDHFAVCVEAGRLDEVVEHYERVFDFAMVFTERIVVGEQAMDSQVVQSAGGAVTLTLIAPDTTRRPGQIDTFLKEHGGAGVQHIAFETGDIIRSVGAMSDAGVEFLSTPDAYYGRMGDRLTLTRHTVAELRGLNVLADEDHDGQLYQIFTKSTHPRGTLFFEIIERVGARTFGSGNIKALYEAVELDQAEPDGR
ncbi:MULTISPECIES: 4-hydroxyphenylpyruvate dioxygenase [Actinoplanes]|uniref:4-hydroxyphenylpyruvate dioxygenase n=1 Tax=Actinoplanes TaxID=1865 RepID=UPI0009FA139C|nr:MULTISPECIES: 4-hydroxyphenylpyruvate dioxygenase [Actinoplanes]GLY02192.1 4-hydroxyphenylpyruvate dioxygenase [Actinoplanes sp. NBRC 101535]